MDDLIDIESSHLRDTLENSGVSAEILAKSNRRKLVPHDRAKYRWRNQIERLFKKPKRLQGDAAC
ncbi:hypothetical protein [Aureimonas sp. AU20]|uniref:hypothetical protein n=1 Tax=Aureimonas sp. AU20 TaxID=1349819 RepID=UPI000722C8F5|nr:hypothetical protein [Aureimonas sp. AU20]ALN75724.1 hypothetical protein M673_23540 [Aureimonas sp. AU20]